MILLRDSEGVTERALIVSRHTAFLLSLMDGTRTVDDIQAEFHKTFGELVDLDRIREIVKVMDSNLLLMNANFTRRLDEIKAAYHKASVREPCLAGKGYPDEPEELLTFLDDLLHMPPDGMSRGRLTGILAPHIDYGRGKEVYRRVYGCLKGMEAPLVVVFGTSHSYTEMMWNISLKDFATPLGIASCPPEMRSLIEGNRELKACVNEWPHRSEHSIELQLPIIQFLTGGKYGGILPILTGSMHQYVMGEKDLGADEIVTPLKNLREVLNAYGKPYLIVAGADLAHIGAQFGDPYPLDGEILTRSKAKDEAILGHVRDMDAGGFFEEIRSEGDGRRICGLTSIYLQLLLLEGDRCDIVDYGQWYDGRSSVSFAGAVFHR